MTAKEINQEWHRKRKKFAYLYNQAIKSYNIDTDYPSGLKAKRINRLYMLYINYCKFKYLPDEKKK